MRSIVFSIFVNSSGGGPFSHVKVNLSPVQVFSSSSPSFAFDFVLKWWSMDDEHQLSTIGSDVGKQTTKNKKLNKILVDSLFFSTDCLSRQIMN